MSSKTREQKKSSLAGVQKQHEQAATTTYVYENETNLAHTQTDSASSESIVQAQTTNETMAQTTHDCSTDLRTKSELKDNANISSTCSLSSLTHEDVYSPLLGDSAMLTAAPIPPPRTHRKRLRSLIPIPINPNTSTPTSITSTPSPSVPITYEHQMYAQIIPPVSYLPEPTYSNQSTLRKCTLQQRRGVRKRSALPLPIPFPCARKPSQTQSTTSSFAFLPYLPAATGKRPSDASDIYHNYLLYATPSKVKAQPVSLARAPAELAAVWRVDMSHRPERQRTMRSHVTTHHPFGLCTCSSSDKEREREKENKSRNAEIRGSILAREK